MKSNIKIEDLAKLIQVFTSEIGIGEVKSKKERKKIRKQRRKVRQNKRRNVPVA